MKIYTEEQVLKIIQKSIMDKPKTYYEILKYYTPIELPSDEEVRIESMQFYDKNGSDIYFIQGAKWMLDKIQGGNK